MPPLEDDDYGLEPAKKKTGTAVADDEYGLEAAHTAGTSSGYEEPTEQNLPGSTPALREAVKRGVAPMVKPTPFEEARPGKGITSEGVGSKIWEGTKGLVSGTLGMLDPTTGLSGAALTGLGINPREGSVEERLNEIPAVGAAKAFKSAYNEYTEPKKPEEDRAITLPEIPIAGLGSIVGMNAEEARESAKRGQGGEIIGQSVVPLAGALVGGEEALTGGAGAKLAGRVAKKVAFGTPITEAGRLAAAKEQALTVKKPTMTETEYAQKVEDALPELQYIAQQNKGKIKTPREAVRAINDRVRQIEAPVADHLRTQEGPYDVLHPEDYAAHINQAVDRALADQPGHYTQAEIAKAKKAVTDFIGDQTKSLRELEGNRQRLNQEADQYFNSDTAGKRSIDVSDATARAQRAAANAIRDVLYGDLEGRVPGALERAGVSAVDANGRPVSIRELRRSVGRLLDIRDHFEDAITRAEATGDWSPFAKWRSGPSLAAGGLGAFGGYVAGGPLGALLGTLAGEGLKAWQDYRVSKNPNLNTTKMFGNLADTSAPNVPQVVTGEPVRPPIAGLLPGVGESTAPAPVGALPAPGSAELAHPEMFVQEPIGRAPERTSMRTPGTGRFGVQVLGTSRPLEVGHTAEGGPIREPQPPLEAAQKAAGHPPTLPETIGPTQEFSERWGEPARSRVEAQREEAAEQANRERGFRVVPRETSPEAKPEEAILSPVEAQGKLGRVGKPVEGGAVTRTYGANEVREGDTFVDDKGEPRRIVEITPDGKIKTADGTARTYEGEIDALGEINSPKAQLARGGKFIPGEKKTVNATAKEDEFPKDETTDRFQWMKNAQGGQNYGNQTVVTPITEALFQKYVKDNTRGYTSLAQLQRDHPEVQYIKLDRVQGRGDWRFGGVDTREELSGMVTWRNPEWVKQVDSFNSPEAVKHGSTADEVLNKAKAPAIAEQGKYWDNAPLEAKENMLQTLGQPRSMAKYPWANLTPLVRQRMWGMIEAIGKEKFLPEPSAEGLSKKIPEVATSRYFIEADPEAGRPRIPIAEVKKGEITPERVADGMWYIHPDGHWFGVDNAHDYPFMMHDLIDEAMPAGKNYESPENVAMRNSIRVAAGQNVNMPGAYEIRYGKPTEAQRAEIARIEKGNRFHYDLYGDKGNIFNEGSVGDFLRDVEKAWPDTTGTKSGQLKPLQPPNKAKPMVPPGPNPDNPLKSMVDPADAKAAVDRLLKRKEGVGSPESKSLVIKGDDGKVYVFGDASTSEMTQAWKSHLSPEELKEWRGWYPTIEKEFEQAFGKGPEAAKKMMAWLGSQQNTSPSGGMLNVMRGEDILSGQPKVKSAGLAENNIMSLLRGETPKGGMGAKLLDFVDSALQKKTRTFMGDDPRGGAPAVIDVHGARGTGFVDQTLKDFVEKKFGKDAANKLTVDLQGAPSETQYEFGSQKYNNVAKELNKRKFDGGGWTPEQVQAVDWARMIKQLGREPELPQHIFEKNVRTIGYEVGFGTDTPYSKQFPALNTLPYEQAHAITRDVGRHALDIVTKESGGHVIDNLYGPGGWMESVSPSAQTALLSSPEAAERATNMLGYLLQQDAVITSRPQLSGSGHYFQIIERGGEQLSNPAKVHEFWNIFREIYPKAEGFMPVRTPEGSGIRILKVRGHFGPADLQALKYAVEKATDRAKLGTVEIGHGPADVHLATNNWKEQPNGEGYRQRLAEIGRPDLQRRLLDEFAPSIERAIREAFQKHAPEALGGKANGTAAQVTTESTFPTNTKPEPTSH